MDPNSDTSANDESYGRPDRRSPADETRKAYARGVRDSKQRLQELSSKSFADSSQLADFTPMDLPGIPSQYADDDQPGHQARPTSSRPRSVDLSRPALPRSRSTQEEIGKKSQNGKTRVRTRTLDDANRAHQLSQGARYSSQPAVSVPEDGQTDGGEDDQVATVSAEDIQLYHLTPPHASFMEHLMKRTRGQMQGKLLYRRDVSRDWTEAYCSLSASSCSLLKESSRGVANEGKIVSDLRGCHVQASYDAKLLTPILRLQLKGRSRPCELIPLEASEFNVWFAALLCWQAVRSLKTLQPDSEDAQLTPLSAPAQRNRQKPRDDKPVERESAVVTVSKLLFWNGDDSAWPLAGGSRPYGSKDPLAQAPDWLSVSCILREGGELKILTTTDIKVVATVRLSKLNRSAVQRLCPSVLDKEYTIAIYPKYARFGDGCSLLRPLYLSTDSRVVFETWFVLLRAFTLPELYGPATTKDADSLRSPEMLPGLSEEGRASQLFRVERSLHLTIGEYKSSESSDQPKSGDATDLRASQNARAEKSDFYVQVLVDGSIKAKTRLRSGAGELQWFQPIEILDLAPTVSFATVQVRRLRTASEDVGEHDLSQIKTSRQFKDKKSSRRGVENVIVGELIIPFGDHMNLSNGSKRWHIINELGQNPGELSVQIRLDRDVVLLDQEYSVLSELLHEFSGDLTLQMADAITPDKLSLLSDHLLNVFQASGSADGWLQSLAEEEIDGIRRSGPSGRPRVNGGAQPNDSRDSLAPYGPPSDREGLLRDQKRATIAEANLLFRGNTLLSKALDNHMQRLGRDYLEETLGPKMREISNLDQDIEVDPSRISATASSQYNWHRLIEVVQTVWKLIRGSASRCPDDLRIIFRHIRACAEEKYGGRLKNIPYASVSGFLFLRFFCPAILNPFLFGLVNEFPRARAQRGFTLIAKSLQGLANQTTFGAKEPWLAPMNDFLNAHRGQFRDFIDDICSVSADANPSSAATSYATAFATFSRLSSTSKEGSLSLPYLIDSSRSFAALVDLWLNNFSYNPADRPLDQELLQLHNLCLRLRKRTQDLFKRAERGEKRSGSLLEESTAVALRMRSNPEEFWVDFPVLPVIPKVDTTLAEEIASDSKAPEDEIQGEEVEVLKPPVKPTASRPSTPESDRDTPRPKGTHKFRSRSRSRTASPLRIGESDLTSPTVDREASRHNLNVAKKSKSKEMQGRGLFGRKKKSDK